MQGTAPIPAADGDRFAYPSTVIGAALLRTGIGLALTLGPLAVIQPTRVAVVILGGLALIFVVYGAQALIRSASEIVVTAQGLRRTGPIPAHIQWDALVRVKLSYYTTKRDRADGWMVLTIRGTGRAVRIESTLKGFGPLLARIVAEAQARGIALPAPTRGNLRPFGIDPDARPSRGLARCPTS